MLERLKFNAALAAVVLGLSAFGEARTVSPLTGEGWTLDGAPVRVPHTWCVGQPEGGYLRRTGVYRRALPDPTPARRQFLRFEGVATKATVRVNGREVGRHLGPVTPFTFEITSALKPAGNVLEVEADNRVDRDIPPMSGDFPLMGGIYRDCWLIEAPADAAFDGGFFADELEPAPPRPNVQFRADGLYIDGKRTVLRGVNYHQDGPDGWVLEPGQEERDLEMIKAMGANAVRTCHYPRSSHFYDLCDRMGIYVWTELPLIWEVNPTPEFLTNTLQAAREMVLAHRHHPCIIAWGVYNELNIPGIYKKAKVAKPTPVSVENAVAREANRLIRELDPTRPTTAASCYAKSFELNAIPDTLGFNIYPGWYVGEAKDLRNLIDEFCRTNNRGSIALSEYGAGAFAGQYKNPRPDGWHPDPTAKGTFQPEDYQALVHEEELRVINSSTNLWGVFVWQMFDSYSTLYKQGNRDGINNKGLATRDRRIRKDAYFLYKANWNPEPMLHLCGHRMTRTDERAIDVVGYCNCSDRVELRVNGVTAGVRTPDAVKVVRWPKTALKPGRNTIELIAGNLRDAAEVTLVVPSE